MVDQKPRAIICDIDGTLAKMKDRGPYDWDKVGNDEVHDDIANLLDEFWKLGYKTILVSGRLETCREQTEKWLEDNDIIYEALFMRKKDERSEKDTVIKQRIYKEEIEPNYNVRYVFDDRDQVVKMWRELGLRCLQVAPGDF